MIIGYLMISAKAIDQEVDVCKGARHLLALSKQKCGWKIIVRVLK